VIEYAKSLQARCDVFFTRLSGVKAVIVSMFEKGRADEDQRDLKLPQAVSTMHFYSDYT